TFAHSAESLLSAVREGKIPYTAACADLALKSADMLKLLLGAIEVAAPGGRMPVPATHDTLLVALGRLDAIEANAAAASPAPGGRLPAPEVARDPAREASAEPIAEAASGPSGRGAEASVRIRTDRLDRLIDMVGELVIAQAMISQDETVVKTGRQELSRKVVHAGKIVRELQDLSM